MATKRNGALNGKGFKDDAKTVEAPGEIRPGVYDVTFVLQAPDATLSLDTWRFSE